MRNLRLLIAAMALLAGLGDAFAQGPTPENQLDLNRASREELLQLPLPESLVDALLEHRTYVAYFGSLFDLYEIDGMTPEMVQRIRPLIFITPVFEIEAEELREEERRAAERNYLVQRLLSQEGASEGLVDEYLDQLQDPRDVNDLDFFDLVSYQNVSPIDARAIISEKAQSGRIEGYRQLRSAPGLSYYGFSNLRNYVRYEGFDTQGKPRLTGSYQFRVYNTPYMLDQGSLMFENIVADVRDVDDNTLAGRLNLGTGNPYLTNKLRLRYGQRVKFGAITHRNLGETDWAETNKYFAEVRDIVDEETSLGRFRIHNMVLGNYAVTLGQGLIMDSSDFYSPRRTGYGFSARYLGARGDLSRSDEYTLKGGALEATLGRVRGTLFYSRDDKDAILNTNGSFNSYFTMVPRLSDDLMGDLQTDFQGGTLVGAFAPMRDVMDEQVVGANLKYEFVPGTYVGLTGMEMRYHNNLKDRYPDRFPQGDIVDRWDPDPLTLIQASESDRIQDRDSELFARYNSVNLGNYRRIWGAEAQTVFSNVSLAAEYGKLETSDSGNFLKRITDSSPDALVVNGYLQFDAFNFLALYRDYDLGYDNPYNRAFAEDSRYEQMLVDGNPFYLNNPYWSQLGMNEPQPKAERGFYFSTRYQPTRQAIITGLEFDNWTRKADGADLTRLTLRAEYRPIFPVRFRIRHRISSRHDQRPQDVRGFESWDSRIEMRVNLSRYDQMSFLFSTSNVTFASRGRLSGQASGDLETTEDPTPQAGSPARALQAKLTHNFNDDLSATVSTEIYDGFLYNFEDNEFVVLDGIGSRNWLLVRSRLSANLAWRFKWTTDHQLARTYVDIRDFGQLDGDTPDASNARGDVTSYRFQLDYSF